MIGMTLLTYNFNEMLSMSNSKYKTSSLHTLKNILNKTYQVWLINYCNESQRSSVVVYPADTWPPGRGQTEQRC